MSLRAIRLAGIALLVAYALTLTICHAIPDSVGYCVIAAAFLAAFSGWALRPGR